MRSASQPKRVLLLTNSEFGQANVFLAVSYALLNVEEDVDLHFASFEPVRKTVAEVSSQALEASPQGRPIRFHLIDGIDMHSAWNRPEVATGNAVSDHHPTLFNAYKGAQLLLRVLFPWDGPEFMQVYYSIMDIIRNVQPDIVAVDPAFSPALTACRHIGIKFVVLSPNSIKDFALPMQPWGEALWRYPCVGTGMPFPVPGWLVPFNVFLVIGFIIIGFFDFHSRRVCKYVKEQTGGGEVTRLSDLSLNKKLGIKILVPLFPELDYPLKVIPDFIISVGPMLRPAKSVPEDDPDLATWLSRGPTIYINMGTHVFLTEDTAVQMAEAIRMVLGHVASGAGEGLKLANLQVLWKLVKDTRYGENYDTHEPNCRIHNALGKYLDTDVVRIVDWIKAEPSAVLQEKNVICAVHHGGANSFLEAVSASVPQVVLPVWMDTFDFANRAELLGVGKCGNQTARPNVSGKELGPVLVEVLSGPKAVNMRDRAQRLARLCQANGGGRNIAARLILEEIGKD